MSERAVRRSPGSAGFVLFVVAMLLVPADASACGAFCDMPGDRGGVAHASKDAVACESACDRSPECRGWTWVKPGLQGPQGVCWIKREIANARASDCCISGYRGDRTAANSVRQFNYQKPAVPQALPPAAAARPPAAPVDSRPLCECQDERGAWYRPGFGQPCGHPLRDYEPKCRR